MTFPNITSPVRDTAETEASLCDAWALLCDLNKAPPETNLCQGWGVSLSESPLVPEQTIELH